MHLKTKLFLPVLTLVLVFGLANAAFAQESCQVASTPVSRDTDTGHTEVIGDLIFNCTAGATATTTATISVDYGIVITNSTAYPAAKPIAIVSNTLPVTPTISSVNNVGGQVIINLPAMGIAGSPALASGTFTLTGVLASFAATGKTSLTAGVSVSPGNNVLIIAGQNNATVVTSVLPGICQTTAVNCPAGSSGTPKLTTATSTGLILSTGVVITSGFSIDVKENYIDAIRSSAQFNGGLGTTNGVQLLVTLAGIPTGVTIGTCTVTGTTGAPTLSATSFTAAAPTVAIDWPASTTLPSLTAQDTVTLACSAVAGSTTVGATAVLPLTAGNVTATVTLGPTGAALSAASAVLTAATTGQIPRYASNPLPSPALPVLFISPAQTNWLISYASFGGGFDTGLAFANTTSDPYGTAAGQGGSPKQNGTVQFSLYPQNTTTTANSCTFNSSAMTKTVGGGVATGGVINSGSTWVLLLSELLSAAPASAACPTTGFQGYIFAVANFTNGHASAYLSDFSKFTSATNVLVLYPPTLPASVLGGNRATNVLDNVSR